MRGLWLLVLAELTTVVVLVAFAATTLIDEPGTAMAFVGIIVLGVAMDLIWKSRAGSGRPSAELT